MSGDTRRRDDPGAGDWFPGSRPGSIGVTPPVGMPEPRGRGLHVKLGAIAGLTSKKLSPILPFTFQVPPLGTFPTSRVYSHDDYLTVGGRQHSRPSQTMLKTWTWQTLFTDGFFPWTLLHGHGYIPDPLVYLDILDEIGRDGSPVLLTARNPHYDSGYRVFSPATLRVLNDEDREGEIDAKYVTVAFTEYRPTFIKVRLGGGGHTANLPVRIRADHLPHGRQTMYELALYYYGAASKWRLIAKANGIKKNPSYNLRKLGHRKILIPKPPKT